MKTRDDGRTPRLSPWLAVLGLVGLCLNAGLVRAQGADGGDASVPAQVAPAAPGESGAAVPRDPRWQSHPGSRVQRPKVERLPEGRFRIGNIEGDRTQGAFRVPGRLIRTEAPLEFLAVRVGGPKAYESLLELDADAFEVNAACILIGLERRRARRPKFHFDPAPVQGDEVRILVQWEQDGATREMEAAALLSVGGKAVGSDRWIYTGSRFARDGRYFAQEDGTLVGVAHDPSSLFEHREGAGLGDYGAVAASAQAPPVGTPVVLTVMRVAGAERSETGTGDAAAEADVGADEGDSPREMPRP